MNCSQGFRQIHAPIGRKPEQHGNRARGQILPEIIITGFARKHEITANAGGQTSPTLLAGSRASVKAAMAVRASPQVVGASGRLYHLAIMVEPVGSGFLIALAAAPELNWYHNTLAQGHCALR